LETVSVTVLRPALSSMSPSARMISPGIMGRVSPWMRHSGAAEGGIRKSRIWRA
jgi:hypothetical protein